MPAPLRQGREETRPPAHDRAVVFACDDGHLPFACFAADRIARTEPGGAFDVVIAMPDIGNVPAAQRDGPVRFVQVDFSSLPGVPMVKAWISNATYFRWVLPAALEGDYGTLFYLDTDTYLARPGIGRLFDSVDRPVALAAITDFQRFIQLDAKRERKVAAKLRDLGGQNGEYYNAGVLLMQPGPFLAADMPARFVQAAQDNVKFLPVHRDQDQGAMNLAFADEIVPMNPRYNWCSRAWLNPGMVELFEPFILHFAGRGKPWNLQDDPFIAGYAEEYLGYLAQHFPAHRPRAALDSLAWRLENPRHGIAALERVRVALYKRRFARRLERARSHDHDRKIVAMRAAIDGSVLG